MELFSTTYAPWLKRGRGAGGIRRVAPVVMTPLFIRIFLRGAPLCPILIEMSPLPTKRKENIEDKEKTTSGVCYLLLKKRSIWYAVLHFNGLELPFGTY